MADRALTVAVAQDRYVVTDAIGCFPGFEFRVVWGAPLMPQVGFAVKGTVIDVKNIRHR